jgi:hypothetical protein
MRDSTFGRLLIFTWALALTLFSSLAVVGGETSHKTKIKEGVALFDKEDYPGALAAFEEAYRLSPKTSLLFNIAMCQKALFMYVESIATFEKYLSEKGPGIKADRKAEVEKQIAEMNEAASKLVINGAPDGAAVYVNGKQAAHCPLDEPMLMNPGRTVVEVKMEGFKSHRAEVEATRGKEITLSTALEKLRTVLIVECRYEDASVEVDSVLVGGCPYEGEVSPGVHEVVIQAASRPPIVKNIRVPKNGVASIALDDTEGSETGSGRTGSGERLPDGRTAGVSGDAPRERDGLGLTIGGWSLIGLSAASGVVGVLFSVEYVQDKDAAQAAKDRYEHPVNDYSEQDAAADRETFESRRGELPEDRAGIIAGYVGAGVLMAAGAALVVVGAKRGRRGSPRVSVRPRWRGLEISF